MEQFKGIIEKSSKVRYLLQHIKLPEGLDWFLVGGCVYQTIWNYVTDRDLDYGIKDYDVHYWDDDITKEKEERISTNLNNQLQEMGLKVEVANQARVHLWFEKKFSSKGIPFTSLKQAMITHPFTVMCVGLNRHEVYAPYGFEDIFSMTAKYNPTTHIPVNHVLDKLNSWRSRWPELNIVKESFSCDFDGKL
jgi:uncharacterized protein